MKVYNCNWCEYRSTTLLKLKIHVESVHNLVHAKQDVLSASEPITHVASCPFCNQQLCDLSKLKQHIESDHFSTNSDNQESIRIVGTESCFKCDKCTFFGSKKEIEKHNDNDHGN